MLHADSFTKVFVSIDEDSGDLNNTETTQWLDPLYVEHTPPGCFNSLSYADLQTKSAALQSHNIKYLWSNIIVFDVYSNWTLRIPLRHSYAQALFFFQ